MIIKSSQLEQFEYNDTTATAKKTRKILHLINGEHFAGAERVQDLLGLQLPKFGYDASFACLKPMKFPRVRQSNSPLYEVGMKSKFDLRIISRLAEIFKEGDHEAIHAHTPRTVFIGHLVARRCKCPLIYHVHSPVGRDSSRKFHNFLNTKIEKWSLKRVDKMICVSNSLFEYMHELGHEKSRMAVVHNGVPIVRALPDRDPPGDEWTLGTMALFRPRKGTEVLLESLAKLRQRGLKVHLRAVGPFETQEYKTEVMYLVQKLGLEDAVTWTGFQKDVNAQFQQMDLFVLPSLYGEGLPMVVLESMACGVPVVSSRVEGIPEAIRDGKDGRIFEPGDANDLADKISELVGDAARWKTMSFDALTRQRELLSDEIMASKVADIYNEVLG